VIATHDPVKQNYREMLRGPSAAHYFGTDKFGRDIWSRLLFGGRNTLGGALLALGVALVLGVPSGLLAGYYGRWLDSVATWVTNLLMALPAMVVLLASRAIFGPTVWILMVILGVLAAPSFFRLVRGIVADVRGELYVDADATARLGQIEQRELRLAHLPEQLPKAQIHPYVSTQDQCIDEETNQCLGLDPCAARDRRTYKQLFLARVAINQCLESLQELHE
jgi:peptide/nickel transport system permease protein